jgi:2-polyprenyl-3-methyl-5-hydroxy-6-metoxy-1,4-benzoquinol methylase
MEKQLIEKRKEELINRYGEWTATNIYLGHDIWTREKPDTPNRRTRKFAQIAKDLFGEDLANCRILDLACLEGEYAIEFALNGAQVVGIEGREANIEKARFTSEVLGLKNVEFIKDDVRNISTEKYGKFDIIICSGILYHLSADDVCPFVYNISDMANQLVIFDTHISLNPTHTITYQEKQYKGHNYIEHPPDRSPEDKLKKKWASLDNEESFWFTKASLFNLFSNAGFTSVYECFIPQHALPRDRGGYVAIKGIQNKLKAFPGPEGLQDNWKDDAFLIEKAD